MHGDVFCALLAGLAGLFEVWNYPIQLQVRHLEILRAHLLFDRGALASAQPSISSSAKVLKSQRAYLYRDQSTAKSNVRFPDHRVRDVVVRIGALKYASDLDVCSTT